MSAAFPLTDLQEAYLVGSTDLVELGGFRPHYYIEFDVAGFDPGRAAGVLDTLVRRHEHLRTVVVDGGQRVLGLDEIGAGAPLPVHDLRGRPATEQDAAIGDVRRRMCAPGPDPHEWPLLRLEATRVREHRYRVHVVMSLLLLDGASIRQVWSEFSARYADADAELPPVRATFRRRRLELAAEQDGPRYAEHRAYWLGRVDSLPDAPQLPLARPLSSVRPGNLVRRSFDLSAAQWATLRSTVQAHRIMPAAALLHAYAETLATWAERPEFTLNVLHPGDAGDAGPVVGQLSSTLPLAVDLAEGGYWERGQRVQRQLWTDMGRSAVSGVAVLREVAVRRGLPPRAALPYVFNSMLGAGMPPAAPGRGACRIVDTALRTPQVLVDNQVQDLPGGGVSCVWDCVDEAFPAGLAELMFGAYRATVEALAAGREPGDPVPAAHRELVAGLNPASGPAGEARLETGFLRWAAATPAAPAVLTSDRTLTYAQLETASRAVAHRLRAAGTRPGDLVPVVLAKGWEQVVAVLAIERAGAAYCPVDAALPADRIERLLADCRAKVAVRRPGGPDLPDVTTVDVTLADLTAESPRLPRVAGDRALAYVIHTSGSTGTPKGVMIDHRGAVNTIADVNERIGLTSADRVFGISSLSFDLSVWDVFGSLAAGAALVLPDPAPRPDPEAWATLAAERGVTVWNSVPALAELLCEVTAADPAARRAPARVFLLSGDWIPLPLPDRLRSWWPGSRVLALGGATEASIWSNHFEVGRLDPAWRSVPYGRPLRHQTMTVLDGRRRVRAPWATGRIHIGGAGVALGYLGDPETTDRKFVTGPAGERLYDAGDLGRYWPDGTIEFLGRADRQLKIQGFRVEPGEIEAVLLADPSVRECAVGTQSSPGGLRLVAAVVPAAGTTADPVALTRRLRAALPAYMVPGQVAVVDELTLTGNGKVDIAATLARSAPAPGTATAPDALTQELAALWADLLEVPAVGPDQHFFELGGTSLLALRLVHRIRDRHGVAVPIGQVFQTPTVRALAARIAALDGEPPAAEPDAGAVVLADRPGDRLWLFPPVGGSVGAYAPLAADWPGAVTAFAGLEPPAGGQPERTLAEIAARYRQALQRADPDGPYLLGGWSMGGVLAYEVAQQLCAAGRSCTVLMIDSDARGVRGRPDGARAHLEFLTDLAEGRLPAAVRRRLTSSTSDAQAHAIAVAAGLFPAEVDLAAYRRLAGAHARNLAALAAYRPGPAAAGMRVFLAAATRSARPGAAEHWRSLCPDIVVDRYRADHYTIAGAGRLREIARRWQAGMGADGGFGRPATALRRNIALWTHSKGAGQRTKMEG
ncbi:non-ribosomal peptide synthetase [Hamadaea tsunoensis]|uniref:non-ribosomal peptide synthetase n=1 Tax=Hamadaea tsunoensis TaxID=53368 RepID=UPI0003F56413|nr:non-ribosomal peptide synthetase [Hamadaea tsunoensis]